MTTQIFFPTISLFGIPTKCAFDRIDKAGFDGVEVLVTSRNRLQADHFRGLARERGMGLHWHQPWSYTENTIHWYNGLANRLGMLEPGGYKLSDVLPMNLVEPIVVYADRWDEARGLPLAWLQTCTVMNSAGKHSLPFARFLELVREYQSKIVFDTQHFLEWYFGCPGISGLPTDIKHLEAALLEGWSELGPYVAEIHCNDFDPRRGNSWGRNLILGHGIAPLESFAQVVHKSGWQGVVTPEISPFHLFPYRLRTMRYVRDYVAELFY